MTNLDHYLNPPAEVYDPADTPAVERLRFANYLNRFYAASGNYRLGHENGNTTVWDRIDPDRTDIPKQCSVSRCYDRTLVESY
jgi:hypothetical protein